MRRFAVLFASSALWLFLLAVPALADNGPHVAGLYAGTTTDACAGCHRAHSAAASNLLLEEQPGLCYTCHGSPGSGAQTDVEDGTYYSLSSTPHVAGAVASGALRGGGFQYALINSSAYTGTLFGGGTIGVSTPAATTSHHSVDESPQTLWGSGVVNAAVDYGEANVKLACGSCHDPHGNHQYRILKPGPTASGIGNFSFEADFNNGGRVYLNDAGTKIYPTTNFATIDAGNTSSVNNFGNGSGNGWDGGPTDGSVKASVTSTTQGTQLYGRYTEASSEWCATCHDRYMAPSGSAVVDSGDAVFTYRHAVWQNAADHGPKCLTCHVSHGSNASMTSLITSQFSPGVFGDPNAVGPLDGANQRNVHLDSTLLRLDNRGVCEACHAK